MYKVDATGIQLLLGYSDVFGEPAPNLIEEIPPFSNYLRGKGLKPEMTSFMNGWYKQATEEMAVFLRSNEENQVGD